jgi:nucleotide-binding universal stress UspA family protein
VAPERISTECTIGSYSRAADILAAAREGNYGTVIMGRRGISAIREFILGRVTTRVLNGAEGLAVWIVP